MKQTRRLKALHFPTRGLRETCRPWILRLSRKKFIHQLTCLDSRRTTSRTCSLKKSPTSSTFQCWKTSLKTEVYSGTDWPSESTRWIWEVELLTSVDDLKTSRSVLEIYFPNLETLDAKIASSLKKVLQNSNFKKKGRSRIAQGSIRWPIPSRKTERSYDLMNISG